MQSLNSQNYFEADLSFARRCTWGARLARCNGEDEKAEYYDLLFEKAWARIDRMIERSSDG